MISLFLRGNQRIYHKMGYYTDQTGIIQRYLRESNQWDSHLTHTKEAILSAARQKDKGKIAILGSGWLLDIPYHELCEKFEEVWLFDIHHPAKIKEIAENIANLNLFETDISGFALPLHNWVKDKQRKQITALTPDCDFDLSTFDCVISCNILNQLDILLLDFAKQKIDLPLEDERAFRTLVQTTHLQMLPT
jgi:hypothetical protein